MLGSHSPDLLLWRTVRLVVAFHFEIGLGRCLRLGDVGAFLIPGALVTFAGKMTRVFWWPILESQRQNLEERIKR
jgi:hypothetical protein